ncbi:hypothetical protein SteCoe_34819 [Stentor coeruleus]|uniref:asparaginase n=1 Tax=Stentor coeruleus TaxID=5963 RepID=A0A1R2ATR4_9CILI|nr:hypothetical protein SteCoe_34819 [Stentor coeruleus]
MSMAFHNDIAEGLHRKMKRDSHVDHKDSKVLIIYTGGTIGMVHSQSGYVPATNIFANALRQNLRFHDPDEHALRLLTHAGYSDDMFITPLSFYKKRISYRLIELSPLLDSSNMQMKNWIEIAEVIEKNYYDYDGFLVLHGTDTMAYTASILSFILENLQKPVILTGSQIPYFEVRTDAAKNLLDALTIAGHFNIPEVCLYFSNKLFRGNRTSKIDNSGFDSFNSPNCSYLVKSGISYKVKWDHIRHPRIEGRFYVQKILEENISILHIFPIITLKAIQSATQEPAKAVIIMSYGTGNIPSNRIEFLEELKKASERGVILLNITQCQVGGTTSDYECGKILMQAGVVLGRDITLESAVTKLSYLLGKYTNQPNIIRKLLRENLRGEITIEESNFSFSYSMQNLLESIGNSLGLYSHAEKAHILNKCVTMLAHDAAFDGHIEDLKKFGEDHLSMERKDHEGRTLLHVACRTGNAALVDYLLEQNVMINPVDSSGNTPLLLAIQRDYIKIAEKLIEKGGDVRNKSDYLAYIICDAAKSGHVPKLHLLVSAGVNVNTFDFQGRTAGHAAVINNQIDAVKYLKEHTEFNWDCKDVLGFTPLDIAEKLELTEIIALLKEEEEDYY